VSEVRVSGFLSTGQQLACLYSGEDRTAGDPYLGRTVNVAFDGASEHCAWKNSHVELSAGDML
jgi:hypothetical protein